MTSLVPILVLAIFLIMAALMYMRRISALLAVPIMALLIAIVGGIPAPKILTNVISEGSVLLKDAYTTTMFGAILAELMNRQGIAKTLVRWVAEFAGDNPFVLGLVLTAVTALLFSTLGGLGAVIMIGTIILPVMLSIGISNVTAGSLFLFGISLGGMFNLASWVLYVDVLQLEQAQVVAFVLPFAFVVASAILVFLAVELGLRKHSLHLGSGLLLLAAGGYILSQTFSPTASKVNDVLLTQSFWASVAVCALLAMVAMYRHRKDSSSLPGVALFTPVVPLLLVLGFRWEIMAAFVYAIAFGVLTTWKRDSVTQLTRSIIDGIVAVIPAVFLMIGIGMLITAVRSEQIAQSIGPIILSTIPNHAFGFVVVFTIIAPLALYRGPLSIWGMGSALAQLIRDTKALTGPAIMGMLMSVGQLQGICDPTNTHNIWIATYLRTDTHALLRKTIPYAWLAAFGGLILSCAFGYVPL